VVAGRQQRRVYELAADWTEELGRVVVLPLADEVG